MHHSSFATALLKQVEALEPQNDANLHLYHSGSAHIYTLSTNGLPTGKVFRSHITSYPTDRRIVSDIFTSIKKELDITLISRDEHTIQFTSPKDVSGDIEQLIKEEMKKAREILHACAQAAIKVLSSHPK